MQNILESTSKTRSLRVLFWQFFLPTSILLLSHTLGLAQDSGASTGTSYSPMTKKERWRQYLNDNFASQGPYFRAFGASLGDSTANKPAEWGGPSPWRRRRTTASTPARFATACGVIFCRNVTWPRPEIRERRRTLRCRNLLVRQAVQMKNKIAGLLIEAGVSYNKQKLHKVGYFRELLATNKVIHDGLRPLLRLCRETLVRLGKTESALVRSLGRDPFLVERVERLMTIPAVGPITALTWALEIGEVQRFSSIKKAISYCGLCGAEKSSGNTIQRTPLSKQRNKHLQTVLIEAAKMAPRNSPALAMLYDQEKQKGNANRATLAVARKLVAYLVAVDRRQKDFLTVERENRTAA